MNYSSTSKNSYLLLNKPLTMLLRWLLISAVLLISFYTTAFAQSYAIVSGNITNAKTDSIICIYSEAGTLGKTRVVKTPLVNNHFFIKFFLNAPAYIDISDDNSFISGLIEPNDSVVIAADFASSHGKPLVKGRGKEKFIYRQQTFPLGPHVKQQVAKAKSTNQPLDYLLDFADSLQDNFIQLLDGYKASMGNEAYAVLRGDLEAFSTQAKFHAVSLLYSEPPEMLIKSESLSPRAREELQSMFLFDESYFRSNAYVMSAAMLLQDLFQRAHPGKAGNLDSKYAYISNQLPPKLRAPVFAYALDEDINGQTEKQAIEKIISQSFKSKADTIYTDYLLRKLNDTYSLEAGMPAPDFTVENTQGERVQLSDFKGKVVYIDFWFATCPPCHSQFESLKAVKQHFRNQQDVVFLNVSVDSKEEWLTALDNYKIEGYHVYTENKKFDHPIIKDYKVYDYPTNRLIGRDGKIAVMAPSDNPSELIKQIEAVLAE
jgi:peroxiredoxin